MSLKIKAITRLVLASTFVFVLIALAGCSSEPSQSTTTSTTIDENDYTPTRTVNHTEVVLYEGPSTMDSSSEVDVKVNNQDVFVYETLVNLNRYFSFTPPSTKDPVVLFDFEGTVNVEITVNNVDEITSAVIRPLEHGIEPTISGNTISFPLTHSGNYVVEYNDNIENTVMVFANTIDRDAPDPENLPEDTIYIGPGIWKADSIPVEDNTTIYIAGGAYVYGNIIANGVENVTIRGRGIIAGEVYSRTASKATVPIEFQHSTNISIEGLTFLNPAGWTISSYFNDGFYVDNVRVVTARANGDGVSLQSTHNAEIKNMFIRAYDDALVVKNYDRGTSSNQLFENIVIWTDFAQSMEIGYETNGETIEDITFNNITVLHNFHKPVFSIHNADDAAISNITFNNVTVEDAQIIGDNPDSSDNYLLEFEVDYYQIYSKSTTDRGSIDNVTVNNVKVLDGADDLVALIAGNDENSKVTNVKINNFTMMGTKVTKASDLNLTANEFTSGISYNFDMAESTGAALILPYINEVPNDDVASITVVETPEQEGFLVPEFAITDIPDVYIGDVVDGQFNATATHGTSIITWDDGTGPFEQGTNVAANTVDGDLTTGWIGKEWSGQAGEYAALTIELNESKKIGSIRVYADPNSTLFQEQNIAVYGISSDSTRQVYAKILNNGDYEFTPATGNYVDIKIPTGTYDALQLRFYNREGAAYASKAFASEVEFYPASYTFGKNVDATDHFDVYPAEQVTDGNPLTYYEAVKGWPAYINIDMEDVKEIQYININLPPLLAWTTRTQNFEVQVSVDGGEYTTVVDAQDFVFDPTTGNVVQITLDEPVSARYVKFIFNSNTGGYGAQVSEISVY